MTDRKLRADLVLEGGGVKGIALVGAVAGLEEAGYLFPRVAGTSAGAIVGAFVASGMTTTEMREVMLATNFREFQDPSLLDRLGPVGKAISILLQNGIYEGAYLKKYLAERLPDAMEAFSGLRLPPDPESDLAEDKRFRLVVMASDVTQRALVRFPWDYRGRYGLDPDQQSVVQAVRASMSIPYFFEPAHIEYDREVDGRHRRERSTLVDGGMLSNFPVDAFDRKDGKSPRWPTFGIKLSTLPEDKQAPKLSRGPFGLALGMLGTLTSWYDGMHINDPAVCDRTIFVDTFGISPVAFDVSRDDQEKLYNSGRDAAERFLARWDFEQYKKEYR